MPKNPRFIRDDKFKKLVQSIKDDPEMLELRELVAYDNHGKGLVVIIDRWEQFTGKKAQLLTSGEKSPQNEKSK